MGFLFDHIRLQRGLLEIETIEHIARFAVALGQGWQAKALFDQP